MTFGDDAKNPDSFYLKYVMSPETCPHEGNGGLDFGFSDNGAVDRSTKGAVTEDGTVYLWGWRGGMACDKPMTLDYLPLGSLGPEVTENVEMVAAGANIYSVVTKNGDLYDLRNACEVRKMEFDGEKVVSVSVGGEHVGAVTESGKLYMWSYGHNNYGQIGNNSTNTSQDPVKVLENVKFVELGIYTSAAVTQDGSLWMWGLNDSGQIGNGGTENQLTPVKILENVVSFSQTGEFCAAITKDGELWMWGANYGGQIGNGSYENQLEPLKILENVAFVSLGFDTSGAVTRDGKLYVWGNIKAVLPDGPGAKTVPECIVDKDVVSVSLGHYHIGVVKSDASLWMGGINESGQVGIATVDVQGNLEKVMDDVMCVRLTKNYSTAVTLDGTLYGWGQSYNSTYTQCGRIYREPQKLLEDVSIP